MSSISGLYAIADSKFNPCTSLPQLVGKFLAGGCRLVQLRMKSEGIRPSLWNDDVFEAAKEVMGFKKHYDFTFIINDYVDVAAELRADGVHVGKNDMPVEEIRRRVGERLLVGYSSHSLEEAIAAERAGADYVALGAIYPTRTKGPGHPVVGVETLRQVTQTLNVPVVAIGGINRENYMNVYGAGASAAAMITALTTSGDIVSETKWFADCKTQTLSANSSRLSPVAHNLVSFT
jgi:thiamine-phosphate pyrophosphorylase